MPALAAIELPSSGLLGAGGLATVAELEIHTAARKFMTRHMPPSLNPEVQSGPWNAYLNKTYDKDDSP